MTRHGEPRRGVTIQESVPLMDGHVASLLAMTGKGWRVGVKSRWYQAG